MVRQFNQEETKEDLMHLTKEEIIDDELSSGGRDSSAKSDPTIEWYSIDDNFTTNNTENQRLLIPSIRYQDDESNPLDLLENDGNLSNLIINFIQTD